MPARLRDLKRALERFGCIVEQPSSGSHWKAILDGKTYPIPAHNGLKEEIADHYIRGVCRAFGFDEAKLRRFL